MAITGYTDTFPNELLSNPAIVTVGAYGAATVWGVTRNGTQWDPQVEVAEVEFDGKLAEVKGMARRSKTAPKLAFTVLQLGTAAEIQRIEPGATTATSTVAGITSVITPRDSGQLFGDSDYLEDVRAIFELGEAGKYISIHIFTARVKPAPINGGATGEAEISVELTGVVDMATRSMSDPLHEFELLSALPTA